jgi:hypothetical protein
VTFRAVSLARASEQANKADANLLIAFRVEAELRACDLFDPTNTVLSSNISPVEEPGTFTFKMNLQLKRPFKL